MPNAGGGANDQGEEPEAPVAAWLRSLGVQPRAVEPTVDDLKMVELRQKKLGRMRLLEVVGELVRTDYHDEALSVLEARVPLEARLKYAASERTPETVIKALLYDPSKYVRLMLTTRPLPPWVVAQLAVDGDKEIRKAGERMVSAIDIDQFLDAFFMNPWGFAPEVVEVFRKSFPPSERAKTIEMFYGDEQEVFLTDPDPAVAVVGWRAMPFMEVFEAALSGDNNAREALLGPRFHHERLDLVNKRYLDEKPVALLLQPAETALAFLERSENEGDCPEALQRVLAAHPSVEVRIAVARSTLPLVFEVIDSLAADPDRSVRESVARRSDFDAPFGDDEEALEDSIERLSNLDKDA